jgi:DNA-binding XRE family transcriptional regulator
MASAKDWDEIRRQIPVDAEQSALYRRVVEAELRRGTLDLGEVRRARRVSQATVADALDVSQPNVSRIEQEDDVRLSTLGRYIAALGGRLEVTAVFEDGAVPLLRDPPRRV